MHYVNHAARAPAGGRTKRGPAAVASDACCAGGADDIGPNSAVNPATNGAKPGGAGGNADRPAKRWGGGGLAGGAGGSGGLELLQALLASRGDLLLQLLPFLRRRFLLRRRRRRWVPREVDRRGQLQGPLREGADPLAPAAGRHDDAADPNTLPLCNVRAETAADNTLTRPHPVIAYEWSQTLSIKTTRHPDTLVHNALLPLKRDPAPAHLPT